MKSDSTEAVLAKAENSESNTIIKEYIEAALHGDVSPTLLNEPMPQPKIKWVLFGDYPTPASVANPSFLRITVKGVLKQSESGLKATSKKFYTKIGGYGRKQRFGQIVPVDEYATVAIKGVVNFVFYASSKEEKDDILHAFREICQ